MKKDKKKAKPSKPKASKPKARPVPKASIRPPVKSAKPDAPVPRSPEGRLAAAAARVKLVLLDVDGVLTDGGIVLGETRGGEELEIKKFSVKDGLGLTLARAAGLKLGILTGRTSRIVERRARELGFDVVEQGHFDKTTAFQAILRVVAVEGSDVLYIGDDLLDLRILTRVGFPVATADSPEPVRKAALYVTERRGGDGAVREVVDLLLKLSGRTDKAYRALGIQLP